MRAMHHLDQLPATPEGVQSLQGSQTCEDAKVRLPQALNMPRARRAIAAPLLPEIDDATSRVVLFHCSPARHNLQYAALQGFRNQTPSSSKLASTHQSSVHAIATEIENRDPWVAEFRLSMHAIRTTP